jgi:PPOX class probable F420-dependent enzyme
VTHAIEVIIDAEIAIFDGCRSTGMTFVPETHQDLLNAEVGVLATIGQDGYPQVTGLWFLFDEDSTIKLSLNTRRQKVKNLQAHAECTFFVLDTTNPHRTLEVRARAVIEPDQDYGFAKKLGAKYGGWIPQDRPGESRVIVSLQPIKVNIWG